MDYSLAPWALTWDDVDPDRHPFDADAAPGLIRELPPAASVKRGDAWADSMTRAMVEVYGAWARGWRWAIAEGDFGGGPVRSWCCPTHSISGAEVTLRRVTDALAEWRGWLEDLAERFDRYPLAGPPESDQDFGQDSDQDSDQHAVWQRAAVQLINHVVERTEAGDAWYRHCAQVLTWFLVRWGVPAAQAGRLVDEAIGGRFGSWIGPDDTVVDVVAEEFARSAAALPDRPDRPDRG